VHITPTCTGSGEVFDQFGSYVHNISLHFCRRLFPGVLGLDRALRLAHKNSYNSLIKEHGSNIVVCKSFLILMLLASISMVFPHPHVTKGKH
jgi:hypothetical protein